MDLNSASFSSIQSLRQSCRARQRAAYLSLRSSTQVCMTFGGPPDLQLPAAGCRRCDAVQALSGSSGLSLSQEAGELENPGKVSHL